MTNPTEPDFDELVTLEAESSGAHLEESKAPFTLFGINTLIQLALPLVAFWLLFPSVFRSEAVHPLGIVAWAVGLGLPLSLFEYLYHRYLLHSAVLPFLSSMKVAHGTHHGLTNVQARVRASEPLSQAEVKSEYPIDHKHQEKSMMFPIYSGPIFVAIFLILLGLPLKALFPGQPIIFAVIVSVVLYYSSYEIWHAVLHLPFNTFWKPKLQRQIVKRVYGFHLMHHWRPSSNLAIVGFWGLAVWDHAFRTYHQPANMPLHQAQVTYIDSKLRVPRWPISLFDNWQGSWARTSRRIERFFARIFTNK